MENVLEQQKIERCVLGEILMSGKNAYYTAVDMKIGMDCFTEVSSQKLWQVFTELAEDGLEIDLVSIQLKAKAKGLPMVEIARLTDNIATTAHLETHCHLLNAFRLERKAYESGLLLLSAATDKDRDRVVCDFEQAIRDYRELSMHSKIRNISEIVMSAGDDVVKRRRDFFRGELAGIPTGLKNLNLITNGWQANKLIIIAARPAMGKTALGVHFAIEAAKRGKNVCIFSMEMAAEEIAERMLLTISTLNGECLRRGELTENDMDVFYRVGEEIARLPIYIDDNSNCSVGYIRTTAKRLYDDGKCDMVIVDYLQLTDMAAGTARTYTRENMVTAASRAFKVLARELHIPVLLLSQLNRAVESRADKKPMLSDLRESGSIEQDADTVLLIHRPEYYNSEDGVITDENGNFKYGVGTINVAKNRNGRTGDVEFYYDRTLSKIWDNDSII